MQLTPSQQKALSTARHLAITANAGSGKTRVLVQRYVNLFLDYPDLTTRNVVAITFTENAAAELRSRVVEEIAERLKGLPANERATRERLRRLRETLPNAVIGTIHSFASRLLRAYPVEANVDAAFTVVQGADQRILAEEAISRVFYSELEEAYSEPVAPPVLQLFRTFGRYAVTNFIRALLQNRARAARIQKNLLSKSNSELAAYWLVHIERALRVVRDVSIPDRLRDLVPFLSRVKSGKLTKAAETFISALEAHNTSAPFFKAVGTFDALIQTFRTDKNGIRKGVFDLENAPDVETVLGGIIAELLPIRTLLDVCPEREEDFAAQHQEYAAQLKTIYSLYDPVLEEYTSTKLQFGLLDFDDLIERLLRLLEDARIREELSGEFRFIMVDEYQDTDESQLELVRRLTAEFSARSNLAIVGDPKQAIYTFRNADAQIFSETMTAIERQVLSEAAIQESLRFAFSPEEELGRITLGETFRMTRAPIAAINRLFGLVMEQEVPFGRGGARYSPLIHARDTALDGHVEWICPLGPSKSKETGEEAEETSDASESDDAISETIEVELIARKIRSIVSDPNYEVEAKDGARHPAGFDDIAVLLRARTKLAMLEKALRDEAIPYTVAKGTGFFEQPEVLDISSYLNFLTVPTNDVALAAILRSPFFAVNDVELFQIAHHKAYERRTLDRPWSFWDQFQDYAASHALPHLTRAAQQLRENLALAGRTSAAMLIEKIYAETGIYATVQAGPQPNQRIANLEKFLALARASDASGFSGLLDFVERIAYLTASDEQEAQADLPDTKGVVKIMTVHEAKGLEFPIVILPFLQKKFNFDYVHLLDKELGLQIRAPEEKTVPILSQLISLRARASTIEEEERIFYVATTRARDHLIFSCVVPEKPNANSWLAWAMESFGLSAATEALAFDEQIGRYDGNLQKTQWQDVRLTIPLIRTAEEMVVGEGVSASNLAAGVDLQPHLTPLGRPNVTGRFSATQLLRHRECPTKYYLASVLGMPEEPKLAYDLEPDEYTEQVRGPVLGQIVHQLLEKFEQIAPGRVLDEELLAKQLKDGTEKLGVPVDEYSSTVRAHLATFLASDLSSQIYEAREFRAEFPLQTALASGDVLNGIIDRLYRASDGIWTILDYKTESSADNERHAKSIERYQFQLGFYAYLVHLFDPSAQEIRGILFFTTTGEQKAFEFHYDDFARFAEECSQTIDQIRSEEAAGNLLMLPRNAEHCYECSYFNRPAGECVVLAADQNPTQIPAR